MISDPLERTAAELQAHAVGIAPTAPRSLVMTVVGALDAEPLPRRGWAWGPRSASTSSAAPRPT